MKSLFLLTVVSLIGCASITSEQVIDRLPAETTATSPEDSTEPPIFRERTFSLFRNVEIPDGSYFKTHKIEKETDNCEVNLSRNQAGVPTYDMKVDFGFYSGIERSTTTFGMGFTSLPRTLGCPNNICEFVSEYMPAPHNMIQITKIWVDPYLQNVTRAETEFRRGPHGMNPENMALQLKATCTPEFIGM
jgi:hypothetical protein